jgi:GST-like protein
MAALYYGEPVGPSFTVLAVLAESGLEIACQPINLLAGDRHRIAGLNESVARDYGVEGEGPVLVIAGEAMTESVFIAQYLDEISGAGLQPQDPYAHWQMLMWCRRITERCAPAAAFLGCEAVAAPVLAGMSEGDFEAAIAPIVADDLRQRWRDTRGRLFPAAAKADSEAKMADALEQVEAQLADGRDWLMGDCSIADFETAGWLMGADFAGHDRAKAWIERVLARPSSKAALARATGGPLWAPGPEINRWG